MNIEDTSIIEDMKKVQEEVKVILKKQTPVLGEESIDVEGEKLEVENAENSKTLDTL